MSAGKKEVVALFADLARALVDDATRVRIRAIDGTQLTLVEIEVSKEDFPRLIGRGGRTAEALRTMATAISGASRSIYRLEFVEPGSDAAHPLRSTPAPAPMSTTELLTRLIESLVDDPDAVRVDVVEGQSVLIFEVTVAREDVRRVIGRGGRLADATRLVLASMGAKVGRKYMLNILD